MSGLPRMKPSFEATYKRADGEHIYDLGWVTELDHFEDDDEPVELIEERWVRVGVRRFWHVPATLYDCDTPTCDEDAVGWFFDDEGKPAQRCEACAVGCRPIQSSDRAQERTR